MDDQRESEDSEEDDPTSAFPKIDDLLKAAGKTTSIKSETFAPNSQTPARQHPQEAKYIPNRSEYIENNIDLDTTPKEQFLNKNFEIGDMNGKFQHNLIQYGPHTHSQPHFIHQTDFLSNFKNHHHPSMYTGPHFSIGGQYKENKLQHHHNHHIYTKCEGYHPNVNTPTIPYHDKNISLPPEDIKELKPKSFTIESILARKEDPQEAVFSHLLYFKNEFNPSKQFNLRGPNRQGFLPPVHFHNYQFNPISGHTRRTEMNRNTTKRCIFDSISNFHSNLSPPFIWCPGLTQINDPYVIKAKSSSGENSDSPISIYRPGKRGRPPKKPLI